MKTATKMAVLFTGGGGDDSPTILYLDEFNAAEAAPIASPHTGDVGTFDVFHDTGNISISDGSINVPDSGSGGCKFFTSATVARAVGLAQKQEAKSTTLPVHQACIFSDVQSYSNNNDNLRYNLSVAVGTADGLTSFNPRFSADGPVGAKACIVLRSVGSWWFYKQSGNWRLVFVEDTTSRANYYMGMANVNVTGRKQERFAVAQLNTDAFTNDNGLEVLNVSSPVSNTTYDATDSNNLDAGSGVYMLEFTLPGSPAGGDIVELRYRVQDASNYWAAYVEWDGVEWDFKLDSVSAGVPTNRISVDGVGTPEAIMANVWKEDNDHFCITREGELWSKRGNTISSTDFDTETDVVPVSVNVSLDQLITYNSESSLYENALNGW